MRVRPPFLAILRESSRPGCCLPLGLLTRKLVDWQAAEELTANLRLLDPADPVKYDFALFGAGVDK